MRHTAALVAALALLGEARAQGFYGHFFDPGVLRLDDVIGMEVISADGESVGRIKDLLYDRATGRVESIALDRAGATYPVSELLSADAPGKVIVDPRLDFSSAGGTALRAAPALSSASGQSGKYVIDLRDGRLRPVP